MDPSDFILEAPFPTSYIQYQGVWDMQDLYQSMVDFFRRQKFKFREKHYMHKRPGPYGADRKHFFEATKKKEDFYRFVVNIYMHGFDVRDIDVKMPDGTTKTYSKGRIWIQIRGVVETDYNKKWESNAFYAQLRNYYNRYIIQKKIGAVWWDELHYKVCNKLRNFIQQRLKMESEEYEHRYFAGVH